jgi:hypothetical protein
MVPAQQAEHYIDKTPITPECNGMRETHPALEHTALRLTTTRQQGELVETLTISEVCIAPRSRESRPTQRKTS